MILRVPSSLADAVVAARTGAVVTVPTARALATSLKLTAFPAPIALPEIRIA